MGRKNILKVFVFILGFILIMPVIAWSKDKKTIVPVSDLTKPRLVVQMGHSGSVKSVAFSPDGRQVLSGSTDTTLRLWDVATGKEIRTFTGHADEVNSVAFSPNGKQILSGSENDDTTLKLWDVATGKEIRTFAGHANAIWSVVFSSNGKHILSGSLDSTIRLWDVATGKKIRTLAGDSSFISSVAFSPDGRYILSYSKNAGMLWDVATGKKIRTFTGHDKRVRYVAFSPDGKYILSGSDDQTIRLWDVATGKNIHVFNDQTGEVSYVAFSPDGKYILSRSGDKIRLRNIATGLENFAIPDHSCAISSITFSPDGKYILLGGDDQTIRLLDALTGKEISTFAVYTHSHRFSLIAFSPDGKYIIFGSSDNTLRLWDVATGKEIHTFAGHTDEIYSVAFSPDGKYILSGSKDRTIRLWNVVTGKDIHTITGDASSVNSVAFSPDGKYFLSGSSDGILEFWDVATGKKIHTFTGHGISVLSVAFSPDGRYIVSGSQDRTVKLWDVATGKEIRTFTGHYDTVTSVTFSPDGKYIISGSSDATMRLWSVATGRQIKVFFVGKTDGFINLTFSPDGKYILSGDSEGVVKLWDVTTGKEVRTFAGHQGGVTSVAFSPDGRYILSASWDKTSILWDVPTGRWLAKLISFTDGTWVVIDPDGRFDTNNLEDIKGLHWIMPDDPLTPLPLEVFMKDYYEPRLLPRILNNDTFKSVKDLLSLNRVLPTIATSSIIREGNGDTVTVTVEVREQKRQIGTRNRQSGISDLKLFRDGQLVGFKEGKLTLDPTGKASVTFYNIRLPPNEGIKEVVFSAYAFNDDGVKSLTDRRAFAIPRDISPKKGKAYLITIGVNRYENPVWNLRFAANDALKIRESLEPPISKTKRYNEIIPVTLTDEKATKENIKAIFDLLSGTPVHPHRKASLPHADKLTKATPEDLLIISFSGHGYADNKGIFYIFTHDTGTGTDKAVSPDLLTRMISSNELSSWLRYVDAGDMAMIIDACHSAATVGDTFKPGPMGSRGLGQLAYDKGMKILAASQADDVALESDRLQHGLLSYALVRDGIEAFQADFKPADKTIYLGEWLAYGVDRVPALYREVRSGTISTFRGEQSRATVLHLGDRKNSSLSKENPYQTPALFDFTRKKQDVYLTGQGTP